MSSSRSRWPSETTALHDAATAARASGRELVDLTQSNPTSVGFTHPEWIYEELGRSEAARYDPAPLGTQRAREAVADYYQRRGHPIDPTRIWLTASTSEAYWQLCTLLCDPGDKIAIPRPGYPLLDHLARAASVGLVGYEISFDGDWYLDGPSLQTAVDQATAAVVVTPNNPTGAVHPAGERRQIRRCCERASVPLIIDQVFADYPIDTPAPLHWIPDTTPGFVLSGLSKVAALPQMKLSWVIVTGPQTFADDVLPRAELLGDAFLSVCAPAQLALPAWLTAADEMQRRILARCRENLRTLDELRAGSPLDRSHVGGGWSVPIRLPDLDDLDDEEWALDFLEAGVLTQPGYLFDLQGPPRVVLSLLTPPEDWRRGLERLLDVAKRHAR